jgi:hypothetical protein
LDEAVEAGSVSAGRLDSLRRLMSSLSSAGNL